MEFGRVYRFAGAALSLVSAATLIMGTSTKQSTFHEPSSATIKGTVVDVVTRYPVNGVEITAYELETGRRHGSALSNAAGDFAIVGLKAGQYSLHFSKTGYHSTFVGGVFAKPKVEEKWKDPSGVYMLALLGPGPFVGEGGCLGLIQPTQTADVYYACSGPR